MTDNNELSTSAQQSGWLHYPGELWDQRKPLDWLEDWPFWEWCAQNFATEYPILELACGNGRITRQLAAAGFPVVAVDLNPHFLNRAAQNLPAEHQVTLVLQDIVQLNLSMGPFALAIMADWAFPALLTMDDQVAFLQRLSTYLIPGGVFVFDTLYPAGRQYGLRYGPDDWHWPDTERTFNPLTQIEMRPSGGEVLQFRHTSLAEMHLLARLSGLTIEEVFGGTDRRSFTGTPDNILVVIMKKTGTAHG